MEQIKERPILFNAEMVKAILEGRKTQTRRVIKPQPISVGHQVWSFQDDYFIGDEVMRSHLFHEVYGSKGTPYGSVYADGIADRLWVKETFAPFGDAGALWFKAGIPDYYCAKIVGWLDFPYRLSGTFLPPEPMKWRPSIHMPRWASRITLEITDIRVEQVRGITLDDIKAEGCPAEYYPENCNGMSHAAFAWFEHLWDKMNLKRGYSFGNNPWVWVVCFKAVTQ